MSNLLAKVLGRIAPGYMTFETWCETYDAIITSRPLTKKTLLNRRNNVRHLVNALGSKSLRSIKPVDIALTIRSIWNTGQQFTARRVLIESVDIFNEAVLAGILNTNPAIHVKQLPAKVKRQRLTFEQWQAMYFASQKSNAKWLPHLLVLALVTGQRRADLQKMRFDDVWDDHLHIIQQKTGVKLALPLSLKLDALDCTLGMAINNCKKYTRKGATLLRKIDGEKLTTSSLTARFEELFNEIYGCSDDTLSNPSLHECRSLSERLYRKQGIDTKTLLGHTRQSTTDQYNNDRGLSKNEWKHLVIK